MNDISFGNNQNRFAKVPAVAENIFPKDMFENLLERIILFVPSILKKELITTSYNEIAQLMMVQWIGISYNISTIFVTVS